MRGGFIDGAEHNCKEVAGSTCDRLFEVWGARITSEPHREELYEFQHIITLNNAQGFLECSCKMFTEVGILSSHCLRVLHACCVDEVLDQYIINRWWKGIKYGQSIDSGISSCNERKVCSSIWQMQMMRKMDSLIIASQMNKHARGHCERFLRSSRS